MPMLRPDDAAAIRDELAQALVGDVKLTLVGPSALSPPAQDLTPQIRALLDEVAALSPKLSTEYVAAPTPEQRRALGVAPDEGGPLTVVQGAAKGRVRYLGAPSGHEFPGFIRTVVDVSTGDSGLTAASRAALARLTTPVHIRVFFTPT